MRIKWTLESLQEEAKKYKTRTEWAKKSKASYLAAARRKMLDALSSHMDLSASKKKWSEQAILNEALKYKSKSEWQRKSPSSYVAAQRKKLLKKASAHMSRPESWAKKWTKVAVIEDAKRFSSRKEWQKQSPAWKVAQRNKWLDEACAHMENKRSSWTKEAVAREAMRFQSKNDWIKLSKNSYQFAQKMGWLNELSSHMKAQGGVSSLETELLNTIKSQYPKAHSAWFQVKEPEFAPAKRFQLDIYVPELRKGIEFNGNYWHSLEGLTRSRKKNGWSEDQIKNYHALKKSFFKSRQIEVMEIWENDWLQNKELCLSKCFKFLGIGENV
jgi:hypothetical protein